MVLNLGELSSAETGTSSSENNVPCVCVVGGFFLIEWAEMGNGKQSALLFDCYLC